MQRSHCLRGLAALGLMLAAAACGRKENAATDTGMAAGGTTMTGAAGASVGATTHAMGATTGAAGGALTDPNIVALLDEANMADSANGKIAEGKATHADVKQFARMMMSEHHGLRQQGEQLAKKLGVTPQPPASDPLKGPAQQETDTLNKTPKGAAFDKLYIDQEVAIHQAVLQTLQQAQGAAQNPELKNLIQQATPVIQKHLDRAKEIQGKLGKSS